MNLHEKHPERAHELARRTTNSDHTTRVVADNG